MEIVVCIKQILDPEIPPAKFRLDTESKQVIPPEGIPPVINPYDERAVELALRFKEKHGGRIKVITIGGTATAIVKHALSMGADEGIVLADDKFDDLDSFAKALILTKTIQKMGNFDIVLCGRQAADWDEGLVGSIIAKNLDLPLVTLAEAIDFIDGELRIRRATLEGYQLFACPVPAVVTVSSEVGRPRLPSGWGIIAAARKQVPVWNAGDLGLDSSQVKGKIARRKLVKLYAPERERRCDIIKGETVTEAAANLAVKLREAKVI